MKIAERKKKSVTAKEAYSVFGVTRSWLRENCEMGNIRKTELKGVGTDGRPFVRNLYNVKDIEKVIMENVVEEEPKY